MSVPKAKALLTVCAALLLCGCGQALSEREIVRAVFSVSYTHLTLPTTERV